MSAEAGPDRRLPIGVAVAVAALLALAAVAVLRGDDAPEVAAPTEAPAAPATQSAEAVTATASPARQASPAATERVTPAAGPPPEEADVAMFLAAEGPADLTATGDVTGDGVDEVVIARVADNSTEIVVGLWDGSVYRRVLRDEGGSAESVETLQMRDYNGVAGGEIVTEQVVGEQGRSISVWGADGDTVARQVAEGGCWDGFHTYGVNGATIEQGRITATCDASALPGEAQTRDVYRWRDDGWTYARTTMTAGE